VYVRRKPSKTARTAFDEAERIAEQMLALRAEELRLRELLEEVRRTRTHAMAALAVKAQIASEAKVAECKVRQADR
jgi:hypothetical protein